MDRHWVLFKIHNHFANLKLRDKFLLVYILLLFLPLALTTSYFISFSIDTAQANARQSIGQTLNQASLNIGFKTDVIELMGYNFFANNTVRDMFSKINTDPYDDTREYKILSDLINNIRNTKGVQNVRLYVPDYKLYSGEGMNIFPMQEAVALPYIKPAIQAKKYYGWTRITPGNTGAADKEILYSYVVLIFNYSNINEILACLMIDTYESQLFNSLESLQINPDSILFVLDENNQAIYQHSREMRSEIASSILQTATTDAGTSSIGVQSERYELISCAKMPNHWQVLYAVHASSIARDTKQIITVVAFFVLALMVATCVFAVILSNRITGRIYQLTRQMEAIQNLSDEELLPLGQNYLKDEVGILESSIDGLLSRIRKLITANYGIKLEKREAQLKLLQAQINPHFLYNVLDAINWLALKAKVNPISEMAANLGRFYRISLSKGQDIITIRDEIEHAKLYFDIQRIRLACPIQLHISVPDELLDYKVLKLILQPLVENAIMHGIMETQLPVGIIRIEAVHQDRFIKLYVKDNAAQLNPEKAYAIINSPNNPESNSYGLRNVNSRIKLYFGDAYELSFALEAGQWSIVEISIPEIM